MENTVHNKCPREEGFILVLFALSIVVVLGSLALVIDIGMLMVKQQRQHVALDLASLGAATLLQHGEADNVTLTYASYVAVANQFAMRTPEDSEWSTELSRNEAELLSDSEVEGVAVSRSDVMPFSFARLIGFRSSLVATRSAAVFETEPATTLHVVLSIDTSVNALIEYGDGCEYGDYGITCSNRYDRDTYCSPGCASKLDVAKEFAKMVVEIMHPTDTISIIDSAAAAQVILQDASGLDGQRKAEIANLIDGLGVDTFLSPTGRVLPEGYEVWSDPAAALLAAEHVLTNSGADNDNTVFLAVSTGIPLHGMQDGNMSQFASWLDGSRPLTRGDGAPEGSYSLLQYEPRFSDALTQMFTDGECEPAYLACNSAYGAKLQNTYAGDAGGGEGDSQDPDLELCDQNPTTYLEYFAGLAAKHLQENRFLRMYSLTTGVHESRYVAWIDHHADTAGVNEVEFGPYASIYRDINFNLEVTNDLSKLRTGTNNRLECLGRRPANAAGLHRDLQPSGYSIQRAASEILNHGRRRIAPIRGMASIIPHLIDENEALSRGAYGDGQ